MLWVLLPTENDGRSGVPTHGGVECRAQAVVIVPDQQQTWYPVLADATVRSNQLSNQTEGSVFHRMHHKRGKVSFGSKWWAMRAVEVTFGENSSEYYVTCVSRIMGPVNRVEVHLEYSGEVVVEHGPTTSEPRIAHQT